MDDTGEVGLDAVPVPGILQPGGERGHHLVGIVTGPVESPAGRAVPTVCSPCASSTGLTLRPDRSGNVTTQLRGAAGGPDPGCLGCRADLRRNADMPGTERVEITGP